MSWLAGNCDYWSSLPCIHLIVNQMSQSLIVDRANENEIFKSFSWVGVEHKLVTIFLIACLMNLLCFFLHIKGSKRSGVFRKSALDCRKLGYQALNAMTDGHSRRNTVRINNHIRHDAINCEGKILLPVGHATGAFLSMARSEFVSNLRYSNASDPNLSKFASYCILRYDDHIYNSSLCPPWA